MLRGLLSRVNAKASQLVFSDLLMSQWLQDIQNNRDQVTHPGHYNDFLYFFSILGTLMDNWEIQKLGLGTFLCDDTRNCVESGELRLHDEIYRCLLLSRVDFSTDGKSTNPVFICASPVLATSKSSPSPLPPPSGVMSSLQSLERQALIELR